MEQTSGPRVGRHWSAYLAVVLGVLAAAQLVSGARLVLVGGSTYFVIAGAVQLACAWWLWRGNGLARPAAHLLVAGTLLWAIWETRGHGWGMVSRLFWPLLVWLLVVLATRKRTKTVSGRIVPSATAAAAMLIGSALLIGRLFAEQQASTQ